MAPNATVIPRVKKPKPKWSMTVIMNARDLSRDDDFLSHLLVEHLGTEDVPLQVHKMDPSRRLPKHNPADIMAILKKYIVRKGGASTAAQRVKRAVDALLELPAVKQYLHKRSPSQINAFATHASRYLELYLPNGSIEISHTSRYSHRTGKSELCILATTPLKVGQVITDLKGSLAHLTVEEDEELKRTDTRRRDGGIRRDFSVIHSNQKNRSHLFLGPARFVNHDCEHNVELFRDGRIITFRVIKPIMTGQEVTAHYGDGYFGKGNRHCLCHTCETHGRGGYAPAEEDETDQDVDDSSTDEETRDARIKAGLGLVAKGNPNERRTRRGVYAILAEEDTDDEDRAGIAESSVNGHSAMEASLSAGNPGNASIHRRLSDASTLTSLSDTEIPSLLIQEPFISLNSPSPSPLIQPSPSIPTNNNRGSTATPKTSRQSSGDVQDTLLNNAIREKEIAILENHKHIVQKDSRRPGRPAKRSLVVTSVSDSRKSSKSGTPVATPAPNNTSKQHFLGPRCGTCSNEIPRLPGQKAAKPTSRTCPRCRRHFVIYGSPWPNRTMNLEPLSSSSDEDDEDDKHNLLDSSGKRRKIDLLTGAGRLVSNGSKLLETAGISPIVGEKRNWDAMNCVPEKEKIIRRLCSVPSLPFAKPIPALYARPSPVFFAKSSWTSAQFIDRGRDDDATTSWTPATRSTQREGTSSLPGLRLTRQTSSTRGMSLTPTSMLGQKRKRDSHPDSTKPRQKIGRTFYMKEGAKKMPKGWVLVTESSEETGDDEAGEEGEDDEGADDRQESAKENSLLGQTNIPDSLEADKPTPTSALDPHVTPTPPQDGPTTDTTPFTNASASPRWRRVRDPSTDFASGDGDPILDDTPSKNSSPRTRSRMKVATSVSTEDSTGAMGSGSALQDEVDSPPGMTNSGSTSECSVDTLPNDSNIDNGDVTLVVESNVISKDSADSGTPTDVKNVRETIEETEVAQSALKISNLIHGTAFSFGHPDARTSWKPRYRYDESLGWVSEPVPST